jgi:hypothetical protein
MESQPDCCAVRYELFYRNVYDTKFVKTNSGNQWRTLEFRWEGEGDVQQIQLRTAGWINGDLRVVASWSGVPLNLQMSETCILVWLLQMYFPHNWNSAQLCQNFGNFGGRGRLNPWTPEPPPPSVRRCCPWKLLHVSQCIYIDIHLCNNCLRCFLCVWSSMGSESGSETVWERKTRLLSR